MCTICMPCTFDLQGDYVSTNFMLMTLIMPAAGMKGEGGGGRVYVL